MYPVRTTSSLSDEGVWTMQVFERAEHALRSRRVVKWGSGTPTLATRIQEDDSISDPYRYNRHLMKETA
jgi:hypothetical protein